MQITRFTMQPRFGNGSVPNRTNVQLDPIQSAVLIQMAAEKGDATLVKQLSDSGISLENVSLTDQVVKGHIDIVEMMAKSGVNLDRKDADGFTALHLIMRDSVVDDDSYVKNSKSFKMFKMLVEAGARTDIPDRFRDQVERMTRRWPIYHQVILERDAKLAKTKQLPVLLAKNMLGINGWELLNDIDNLYQKNKSFWSYGKGVRHAELQTHFKLSTLPEKPMLDLVHVGLLDRLSYGTATNPKWALTRAARDLLAKYKGQELDKTDFVTGHKQGG